VLKDLFLSMANQRRSDTKFPSGVVSDSSNLRAGLEGGSSESLREPATEVGRALGIAAGDPRVRVRVRVRVGFHGRVT